jgi:hypothetical protein
VLSKVAACSCACQPNTTNTGGAAILGLVADSLVTLQASAVCSFLACITVSRCTVRMKLLYLSHQLTSSSSEHNSCRRSLLHLLLAYAMQRSARNKCSLALIQLTLSPMTLMSYDHKQQLAQSTLLYCSMFARSISCTCVKTITRLGAS